MTWVLKIDMSHAREALKANITLESEVEARIRYTSKSLKANIITESEVKTRVWDARTQNSL